MKASVYTEVDALAFDAGPGRDDEAAAINHVQKRKQRTKGAEVTFDPEQHREFITGFRKRKQQRRSKALREIQEKERKQRLQDRAERRAKLKEDLGLDDKWGVHDSSSEDDKEDADANPSDVKVYEGKGVMTTVTTVALDSSSESLQQGSDDDMEEQGGEEGQQQSYSKHAAQRKQAHQKQQVKQHGKKLKHGASLKAQGSKATKKHGAKHSHGAKNMRKKR
mmetsp:Transcript_784/g.1784  ORF Transcript_784/g.1784 Transcript_784/m.1784 type:complete len:222 (-) Transcript_784:2643-3308(-)